MIFRARSCTEIRFEFDNLAPLEYTARKFGAVAQLGERFNRTEEVVGSNPIGSTGEFRNVDFGINQSAIRNPKLNWGCSSIGRALQWH